MHDLPLRIHLKHASILHGVNDREIYIPKVSCVLYLVRDDPGVTLQRSCSCIHSKKQMKLDFTDGK